MIERRVYELSTTATVCGYCCPADCTACRHPSFLIGVFSMQLWVWSNRVCTFVSDVTDVNDKYFEIPPWKLTYLLKMDGWKRNVPFKNGPFLDIFCYIFSVKKDVFLPHFEDQWGRDLREPAGWGWWLSLPSAWAAGDMGWKTRKIWGEDAWIGQRSMIHEMSSSEIPIFFF